MEGSTHLSLPPPTVPNAGAGYVGHGQENISSEQTHAFREGVRFDRDNPDAVMLVVDVSRFCTGDAIVHSRRGCRPGEGRWEDNGSGTDGGTPDCQQRKDNGEIT